MGWRLFFSFAQDKWVFEAEMEMELGRTLTTADRATSDYPRLGYVAFSRARKILCIACLEPISDTTKQKLISLGVEVESPTLNFPKLL